MTTEGPVLVLAGAGTGKTRVLTTRIAHLLATGKARPSQILAVTFTNKAAREMKERVAALVGGVAEGMPWLGTFHSISAKILRRHAELVDLTSDFTILGMDDQLRLMKQLIAADGDIDEKRWPARQLAGVIDDWKNRGLHPHKVPKGEAAAFAFGKGIALYEAYQERLKTLNAADFGDLLLEALRLFRDKFGRAGTVPGSLPIHAGGRVPGHQRGAISLAAAAGAEARQPRLRRRRRPVDLRLARGGGRQHPEVRARLPGADGSCAGRNTARRPHPEGAFPPHRPQRGRLGKTLRTGRRSLGEGDPHRRLDSGRRRAAHRRAEQDAAPGRAIRSRQMARCWLRISAQMREIEDRFVQLALPLRVIGRPAASTSARKIRGRRSPTCGWFAQPADDLRLSNASINTPKRCSATPRSRVLNNHAARCAHCRVRQGRAPWVEDRRAEGQAARHHPRVRGAGSTNGRAPCDAVPHAELRAPCSTESGIYRDVQRDKSAARARAAREPQGAGAHPWGSPPDLRRLPPSTSSLVMDVNDPGGHAGQRLSLMNACHAAQGARSSDTVFLPGGREGYLPPRSAPSTRAARAGLEGGAPAWAPCRLTRAGRRLMLFSFWFGTPTGASTDVGTPPAPVAFIDELPGKRSGRTVRDAPAQFSGGGSAASRFDQIPRRPSADLIPPPAGSAPQAKHGARRRSIGERGGPRGACGFSEGGAGLP